MSLASYQLLYTAARILPSDRAPRGGHTFPGRASHEIRAEPVRRFYGRESSQRDSGILLQIKPFAPKGYEFPNPVVRPSLMSGSPPGSRRTTIDSHNPTAGPDRARL